MKKLVLGFLLMLCLIFPFQNGNDFVAADTENIIINTSYTYLYKTEDLIDHYDFKILNQTKLPLVEERESSYYVSYQNEELSYNGYIRKEFASKYVQDQQKILVYNGRIRIDDTKLYDITTSNEISDISLKKGKEVYIYNAFDAKSEFTEIQVEYNGTIYTGKVLTKNVTPNGINGAAITAIIIIVTTVSIIFIFWGFRRKKKKK